MMTRYAIPVALLLLAACSGGKDDQAGSDASADATPTAPMVPEATPAAPVAAQDSAPDYKPDPAAKPPAAPEPGVGNGDKAIPVAIQGRWALKAEDCPKRPGTDLTALKIDGKTLHFFESAGDLARVRERSATRIAADFKFSGEGMEWDRLMVLDAQDGGKTLIRRDYGEGAAAGPMRYTRCA